MTAEPDRTPAPTAELPDELRGAGPVALRANKLGTLVGFLGALLAAAICVERADYAFLTPRQKVGNLHALHAFRTRPETEDVLLIGSSRFEAGFLSDVIIRQYELATGEAIDVYKLALQGMRPWMVYQLLRDQVRERPPRELLVIGIEARYFFDTSPLDKSSSTGLSYLGNWRDLTELDPFALREHEREAWQKIPLGGLQALWNLDWLMLDDTRQREQYFHRSGGEIMPRGPFVLDEATRELMKQNRERRGSGEDTWESETYPYIDWLGFQGILRIASELPCRVVFVRPPLEATFDERKQPEEVALFRRRAVPEFDRAGLDYRDLVRDPYPTEARFYRDEGSHLNLDGARHASRALVLDLLVPLLSP